MTTPRVRAPIVVTHQEGVRFAAQVGSHQLIVDQPVRAGGGDAGPSPIELLGASLGTCIALYVQQFCVARGLSHAGLRVEVETVGAANPHRIGKFVARVILPLGVPEHYVSMLESVARSCPAHNTLSRGAEVAVLIEAPVGTGAGV